MHHTYHEPLSRDELMQGDVLRRTDEINALLAEVHPHYSAHEKNLYFIVITQSCDLVKRSSTENCKAPYISIAPVRPLDLVVERFLATLGAAPVKAELPIRSDKAKTKATEFLTRLLNNNEAGYFYLESKDTELETDGVAFLSLSIAVKSELHYQKCLDAKILELNPTFQAKLGWLVGQMYSRVGTQDWDNRLLNKKVNEILSEAAIWIEDQKIRNIEEVLPVDASGRSYTAQEVKSAVSQMKGNKEKVLNIVSDEFTSTFQDEKEEKIKKAIARLKGNSEISRLIR